MTAELASFAPPRPEQQLLFAGARGQPGRDRPLPRRAHAAASRRPEYFAPAQPAAAARGARDAGGDALAEEDGAHERADAHDAASSAPRRRATPPASARCSSATARCCTRSRSSMLGHGPQAEDAVQDDVRHRAAPDRRAARPGRGARVAARDPRQRLPRRSCGGPARRAAWPRSPTRRPGHRRARRSTTARCATGCGPRSSGSPSRCASRSCCATSRGASSYEAIAELCGVPVGTVRSRLNAARSASSPTSCSRPPPARTTRRARALARRAPASARRTALRARRRRSAFDGVLTADVASVMSDRVERRGRDALRRRARRATSRTASRARVGAASSPAASSPSSSCGSTARPTSRCTARPALTQVHFHPTARRQRIVSHYAPRPVG